MGGVPIAMPTVLSVTLALGAAKLAKEGAIVARMSAVEEMAGMDILCSDKTGEQEDQTGKVKAFKPSNLIRAVQLLLWGRMQHVSKLCCRKFAISDLSVKQLECLR